jgi:hypothetical protein
MKAEQFIVNHRVQSGKLEHMKRFNLSVCSPESSKLAKGFDGVSISNPEFCTRSKMGGFTDFFMCLHKRIEEKGCEVGEVYPLARSFL